VLCIIRGILRLIYYCARDDPEEAPESKRRLIYLNVYCLYNDSQSAVADLSEAMTKSLNVRWLIRKINVTSSAKCRLIRSE
jgi:hypothetical protein